MQAVSILNALEYVPKREFDNMWKESFLFHVRAKDIFDWGCKKTVLCYLRIAEWTTQ